ncbi:Ni/Fe hydrogenase [bacterium endosymbiont of Escarpia laminata]|uniref:hydrogenase small subunit n=1 Tax=endosymbiont of Lamellibrachia barhami TaxID=205975 RepID=UPI000F22B94B|nr:hydrogenase small subunit [endosymbiont of Lamellibrachia barhami]RLJ17800.1 MAG: Ni/Fe hydrogenase [bacterium endosymbiont of Escarpia laminata]RLJ18412.1 MAG: Ni/Fe hydrogenase [bacterium endosymbiont of Escarpia laminata]
MADSNTEIKTLGESLRQRGVSRRGFLKFCTATASMMALPPAMVPAIAEALEKARRPSVIWLSFQECTGCTESLTRAHAPTIENLIFDHISLDYHHTLQAASGEGAEAAREAAIHENFGKYLVVVDGSIPLKDPGFSTIAGISNLDMLKETVAGAAAVIAVGSCAAFGGLPHANPNPTGAVSVSEIIKDKPVVNVSGCPPIPTVISGVLAHFLTFGGLPELDDLGRPKVFYGQSIHDRCYRRPFYDKGLFAETFDDEGARKGWCLYRMGCKGPMTYNACATTKWNQGTSWPVESGHGCLGCSEPDFWDGGGFYNAISIPDGDIARNIGLGAVAGVAVGAAAGMLNRNAKADAAARHETVTVDDLEKTS